MISADDPFIKTQSDGLYCCVIQEETQNLLDAGLTNNLPLCAAQLGAHRLAEIATIAVFEKNMEACSLKDENAELRKRLIPDGVTADYDPITEEPEIPVISTIMAYVVCTLAIYGVVRIFV